MRDRALVFRIPLFCCDLFLFACFTCLSISVTFERLLARMDGFQELERPTLLVALTNRIDLLDSALLRPGRFEVQVGGLGVCVDNFMVSVQVICMF